MLRRCFTLPATRLPRLRPFRTLVGSLLTTAVVLACPVASSALAQAVDPPELKTLDDHFPFTPPESLEAWQTRAEELRHQLRVASGLWPMPEMSSTAPWIGTDRMHVYDAQGDVPGYSVTPITFEGLDGLAITGSLYRPHPPRDQPGPGILSPHGHWPEGRFQDPGEQRARNQIAIGGERFIAAARSPLQARCVQLARMGCTVMLYDMLGYADSQQISFDRAHRFARQSDAENRPDADGWLLFSPLAESHLQSPLALQSLHSLRALEVLSELPEVDPERIAITGASGGGTQSFIAAAIEPRIAAAFPAVMVSTGMQGGCTCENACLLRHDTGNVEIAATIAPRPLGLTAADDWTRTMPEDGFPELKRVYNLFGAPDAVSLHPAIHFTHNYNHVSRTAMYGFINRIFNLGFETPVLESDFERLEPEQLTVWSDSHPTPEGGLAFERRLLRRWAEQTEKAIAATMDSASDDGGAEFDRIVATGWRTVIGPAPEDVRVVDQLLNDKAETETVRGSAQIAFDQSGSVALHGLLPRGDVSGIVLIAHPQGSQLLEPADAETSGTPDAQPDAQVTRDQIAAAQEAGWVVVFADVEGAGEETQPLVREDRLAAAFTYGYNPPRIIRQARQLVAAAKGLRQLADQRSENDLGVRLVGCGPLAPAAAVARAMSPEQFEGCVLQTAGFRFAQCPSIDDSRFLPGAARYGDLPGLLAMPAPGWLTVVGEAPEDLHATTALFEARQTARRSADKLRIVPATDTQTIWSEAISTAH